MDHFGLAVMPIMSFVECTVFIIIEMKIGSGTLSAVIIITTVQEIVFGLTT